MTFVGGDHATGGLYRILPPIRLMHSLQRNPHVEVQATDVRGWHNVVLSSLQPLLKETNEPEGTVHRYAFLLREARQGWVVVATHIDLVDKILDIAGLRGLARQPAVHVFHIANQLAAHPDKYCMSALFCRVNGYGRSFRTVALYGDDLANALLFREMLPRMVPYRVQLRDVRMGKDVLSIASRGELGFQYKDLGTLREVDVCLSYISAGGFLQWDGKGDDTSRELEVDL